MADGPRNLRAILGTSAAPVPADGRSLVRYMGGRERAVRVLTGMEHRPRRTEYPGTARGAQRHADALRQWRTAQTRVRRWDTEQRGAKAAPKLTPTERRRAQAVDRERRARHLRRVGLAMRIHGRLVWGSPGGDDDDRVRTIPLMGPGEPIAAGPVMDAMRDGGPEAALQAALDAFMDQTDLHAELDTDGAVRLWPADENEPDEPAW